MSSTCGMFNPKFADEFNSCIREPWHGADHSDRMGRIWSSSEVGVLYDVEQLLGNRDALSVAEAKIRQLNADLLVAEEELVVANDNLRQAVNNIAKLKDDHASLLAENLLLKSVQDFPAALRYPLSDPRAAQREVDLAILRRKLRKIRKLVKDL